MDKAKTTSSTLSDASSNISFSARLKRLKIEEGILLQGIGKNITVGIHAEENNDMVISNFSTFSDFKGYVTNIKNMYSVVQQLFLDLKSSISSKQMLESVDIDDIKKFTFELESKLKTLKSYLQKEVNALKLAEGQLNENESTNPHLYHRFRKGHRDQSINYNEIVPSPVKALIDSPFKCPEVQEFQDFMANSPNRYGGWSEYYHSIFVKYWQKYFGQEVGYYEETDISVTGRSEVYPCFLSELLPKLHDVSETEITMHVKWYSKYLHLKNRQQSAVEKWRSNRRIIKSAKETSKDKTGTTFNSGKRKTIRKAKSDISESNNSGDISVTNMEEGGPRFFRKCIADQMLVNSNAAHRDISNSENVFKFLQSTSQWKLRCSANKDIKNQTEMNNIEIVEKLHTPLWRRGL